MAAEEAKKAISAGTPSYRSPTTAYARLLNFLSRKTAWLTISMANSTSAAVLKRPRPNRRLARVKSSLKPKARKTWLGSGLAEVQALPELTASCFMLIINASPST